MATRSEEQLQAILRAIDKLDDGLLAAARKIIETVGTDDIEKLRTALQTYLLPAAEVGAATAAEIGAAVYNEWRVADIGEAVETVIVSAYDEGKYMSAINAALSKAERGGSVEDMLKTLSGRIGYTSRTSYAYSLFENGRRDKKKPKYARVPGPGETCQFCLMLASRGFAYSKGSLGAKVHNHDHCSCTYACSWDKNPKAQGYDPKDYYDEWKASVEQEARGRAEKSGKTVAEERKAIMERYTKQATRAKKAMRQSGAISGALNDRNDPFGQRRENHAKSFYTEVLNRERRQVLDRLAESTGMEKADIETAFNHLFVEEHELMSGVSRFYPDYEIAQSTQRLLEGRDVQEHDLLLFRHELREAELMRQGYSQQEAHDMADLDYNYAKAVLRYREGGDA